MLRRTRSQIQASWKAFPPEGSRAHLSGEELRHPGGVSGGWGGSGIWNWTSGLTKDTLEESYLSASLGKPPDSCREAGERGWEEGCLGFLAETAARTTQTQTQTQIQSFSDWLRDSYFTSRSLCTEAATSTSNSSEQHPDFFFFKYQSNNQSLWCYMKRWLSYILKPCPPPLLYYTIKNKISHWFIFASFYL